MLKRIRAWVSIIAMLILVILCALIGLKLLSGNYHILMEASICLACIVIVFICAMVRLATYRCPECGKSLKTDGSYCPFCGKKIKR